MPDWTEAIRVTLTGLGVVFGVMALIAGATWLSGRAFVAAERRAKERKKDEKADKKAKGHKNKAGAQDPAKESPEEGSRVEPAATTAAAESSPKKLPPAVKGPAEGES